MIQQVQDISSEGMNFSDLATDEILETELRTTTSQTGIEP
jgi:hypothetical protein